MKELAMCLILALGAPAAVTVCQRSNIQCGPVPPTPPGCQPHPRCVCDDRGRCEWMFDCSKGYPR